MLNETLHIDVMMLIDVLAKVNKTVLLLHDPQTIFGRRIFNRPIHTECQNPKINGISKD